MSKTISRTLLQQRVRNRLMDVLEVAASFEDTAKFGTFEVINWWQDWYHMDDLALYGEPAFTADEQRQIAAFAKAWSETADVEESNIFDAEKLNALPHWRRFREAAQVALQVFELRGRLSEAEEEEFPAYRRSLLRSPPFA